ncbi:hypothetical protein ACF0H5_009925 [Mactra antiquata]
MEILVNCTKVNGTVVRIPYKVIKSAVEETTEATDTEYDQEGAMKFIVATVLVYSILGVFCTLINRIRRLRGKSHENYMQDESISKYLKREKVLKNDGMKMKLLYDCSLVEEQVKRFEEKRKLLELEKEVTSDFAKEKGDDEAKRKRYRKKKRDIGSTLGKMGASLFLIGSSTSLNRHSNGIQELDEEVESSEETHVVDTEPDKTQGWEKEIPYKDQQVTLTTLPQNVRDGDVSITIESAKDLSSLPVLCSDL